VYVKLTFVTKKKTPDATVMISPAKRTLSAVVS